MGAGTGRAGRAGCVYGTTLGTTSSGSLSGGGLLLLLLLLLSLLLLTLLFFVVATVVGGGGAAAAVAVGRAAVGAMNTVSTVSPSAIVFVYFQLSFTAQCIVTASCAYCNVRVSYIFFAHALFP